MKLGFQQSAKYIYIGEGEGKLWYHYQDDKVIPISANSIVCLLIDTNIVERERKNKPVLKFNLTIDAGERYIIESGFNTWFTKTCLAKLNSLDPVALSTPIRLTPYKQDGDVIFCSVRLGNDPVKKPEGFSYSDYDDENLIITDIQRLKEKINSSLSKVPTDEELDF